MKTDKHVFFYGGPFSQWYSSHFTVDGVSYYTAEQFMMAKKAEYFDDAAIQAKIMATRSPAEQKALGRMVKGFDAEAWDAVSRGYVYQGNMAKFGQNPELRDVLLNTKDLKIVEASPTDRIWGVGLAAHDPAILDEANWRGNNWLGEVLMKVRDDLK